MLLTNIVHADGHSLRMYESTCTGHNVAISHPCTYSSSDIGVSCIGYTATDYEVPHATPQDVSETEVANINSKLVTC